MTRICQRCAATFENKNKRKFCGKTCFYTWLSETRKGSSNPVYKEFVPSCLTCGKPVDRRKRRRQKFCSMYCMGLARKGEHNPAWKGGSVRRATYAGRYKQWREAVMARDNWTCQECGVCRPTGRGRYAMHAHHKLSWVNYPAERFNIDNGIALCVQCHRNTHSFIAQEARDLRKLLNTSVERPDLSL